MSESTEIVWKDRKHHLWFPWSFTKYYIENERLMIQKGLFNTTLEETLLYRIVDITMKQGLGGKIFGTGSLVLKAKVDATPEIVLENISDPKRIRTLLSNLVEENRKQRNVVGKEFFGGREYSHEFTDEDHDGVCDFEE